MVLKVLDYRKSKVRSCEREEWNYFDNIETASHFFDEEIGMTVVRCGFKDGNTVTFAVPHVAYLMSDAGKTIDAIIARGRDAESEAEAERKYECLQDAADEAMKA
jgi:hypothetical protein